MEIFILFLPVIFSFFILVIPGRFKIIYTLLLVFTVAVITSIPAVNILSGSGQSVVYSFKTGWGGVTFTVDCLSALFILIVNFTMLTGTWFAKGYLSFYTRTIRSGWLFLHLFSWVWLYFSMLAVLALREGTAFLIAWELMGLSSFMLILFEAENRKVLKTAVNYLVQMHFGFILLLIGFLVAANGGNDFGFNGISSYFSSHTVIPLFLIFFSGFAVKAGLIPFHTWLPEAHPSAPSHVSGVMSGVMIKMGFYGIFRVVLSLPADQTRTGLIILLFGICSGLYGIMQSVVQTDLKKGLAWSTIENAGIIATGIGLGTIGTGTGNLALTLLGFGGSLLHILNHSLFKSLLFYTTGVVYQATHHRNTNQLGGLVHRMPLTAALFLMGSLAICALPPFNGFISEVMIYYGMFAGLQSGSFYVTLILMISILAMALTGGLAIFGLTKMFGLTFLGTARNAIPGDESGSLKKMLFPGLVIVFLILGIGLIPAPFVMVIIKLVISVTGMNEPSVTAPLILAFNKISLAGMVLLVIGGVILMLRKYFKIQERSSIQPTWGCGYTAPSPKQQYTAFSFSANFNELANPVLRSRAEYHPLQPHDLFPSDRPFIHHTTDILTKFVNRATSVFMNALRNLARLQTGHIQHYILYAFLFILFIFTLLFLKLV